MAGRWVFGAAPDLETPTGDLHALAAYVYVKHGIGWSVPALRVRRRLVRILLVELEVADVAVCPLSQSHPSICICISIIVTYPLSYQSCLCVFS